MNHPVFAGPMRRVYIAHPLRGDHPNDLAAIERNITRVELIARRVAEEEANVLILSPIHAFSFLSPIGDQSLPLAMCASLLEMADEVRFYGDWRTSEGCMFERFLALRRGLPVFYPEEENHGAD
jgi:hypothetical protein